MIGNASHSALGVQKNHGGMGVFLAVSSLTFLPIMYCDTFLRANKDSYSNLTFVGVPNAFALCILIWILFFTMDHPNEETQFASMLMENTMNMAVGQDGGEAYDSGVPPVDMVQEEF